MAKFTYAEATSILRAAEESTYDQWQAMDRVIQHIRAKDNSFIRITKDVDSSDFDDMIDFYSWFYRWFVGE